MRKNRVTDHAAKRGKERYGVDLDISEVRRQFDSGEADIFEKENRQVVKMFVRAGERLVPVIYNIKRKIVITVLPETALEVIRARIKSGAFV
jgi:hypothetical protein